jgi:hypothetical protein
MNLGKNMITIKENNCSISFNSETKLKFGKELIMFNPISIEKLFVAIDKHTPNSIQNLPKIPNFEPATFKNATTETKYAVTSQLIFNEFITNLKNSLDLITLNDFMVRNRISTYPIFI